jgi:hypothetical protein
LIQSNQWLANQSGWCPPASAPPWCPSMPTSSVIDNTADAPTPIQIGRCELPLR